MRVVHINKLLFQSFPDFIKNISDGQYQYFKITKKGVKMEKLNIEKIIDIAKEDYESYIKAIVIIEKDVSKDDKKLLDTIYNKYMNKDDVNLINDEFSEIISEAKIENKKEKKNVKDFRYKSSNKEKER